MNIREEMAARAKKDEAREVQYKEDSRARLEKIITTKLKTTMIGALEAIEENFSFLWDDDSSQAIEMREVYDKVRKRILDNGNKQIKAVSEELKQNEVKWLRYQMKLEVRPLGEKDGEK